MEMDAEEMLVVICFQISIFAESYTPYYNYTHELFEL